MSLSWQLNVYFACEPASQWQYSGVRETDHSWLIQQWHFYICLLAVNKSWGAGFEPGWSWYRCHPRYGFQPTNWSTGRGSLSSHWSIKACYHIQVFFPNPISILGAKEIRHSLLLSFLSISSILVNNNKVAMLMIWVHCRLVTKGTVDENVYEIAKRKLVLDAAVLETGVEVDNDGDSSEKTMGEILSSLLLG